MEAWEITACEVWPGVYVGDLAAAHFFTGPKLCVRDQPGDYMFKSLGDFQVHFVYGKPPKATFEQAANWLEDHTKERGSPPVLVHCSGGLHRSAAVVVYWLASRKGIPIDEGYSIIRQHRPEIEPRPHWIEGHVPNPKEGDNGE